MAEEARKLREEFDVLHARYREAKRKYAELRTSFVGHYLWLAQGVHRQYHISQKYDRQITFSECGEQFCDGVRRTIEDLKQIEVDLKEQSVGS